MNLETRFYKLKINKKKAFIHSGFSCNLSDGC